MRFALVTLALAALTAAPPAVSPLAAQPGPGPEAPPADFFARHRADYMARMEGGGIAIFPSTPEIPRNDDAGFPWRQDSDFWYLTGFAEPGSVAVLRPDAPEGERFALFVRPRDPAQEVWTGHRAGVEGARDRHGADVAWVIDSLDAVLGRWLGGAGQVWFDDSQDHPWSHDSMSARLAAWTGAAPGREIRDADAITNELRLIKSDAELGYLQKAIDITADAQRAAMAAIRPGMHEYEAEALIEFVFRSQGSPRIGFNSIVGSGPNSTILHYEENDRRMEANDMVVMDIGAEWAYYTADVTRTVPVNGEFSAEQAAIYQIVLDAQNAGIEAVRPGVTLRDVHLAATRVVIAGLIEQGILSGTVEANLKSGAYRRFFMHGTSHWLGLDVHDVGGYYVDGDRSRPRLLKPGMVFSVEPGIYIAEGADGVDPKWWNIGVRIEDDVVVTAGGGRLMSGGAPREIAAIEALMVGRGLLEVVP